MSIMNEAVQAGDSVPEAHEAGMLAREMATAFRSMIDHYIKHYELTGPEAVARAPKPAARGYVEDLPKGSPEAVSWHILEYISRQDLEVAARCWQAMKREAREELASGHRAGWVMEGFNSDPWK
jgi:hypothetical protein